MSINYTANSNPFNIVPGNSFPTINAQRDPAVTDNFYPINTEWVNTTSGTVFKFVKNIIVSSVANAVWDPIAGATAGDISFITGDSGGQVTGDADGNLNLLGTSGQITVTGSPGTNTLTLALAGGGTAVDSFTPDTGTDPVVATAAGLVGIRGQVTPSISGIQVTGGTNVLNIAMFSPFEGDFEFSQSSASSAAERVVYITNADTANATSHSVLSLSTAGTTSGDPFVLTAIGSRSYAAGMSRATNNFNITTAASSTVTPSTGSNILTYVPTYDAWGMGTTPGASSAALTIVRNSATQAGGISVNNLNTASATADCVLSVTTGNGGGTPYLAWGIDGARFWAMGIDSAAPTIMKLKAGGSSYTGATTVFEATETGAVTIPAGDFLVTRSNSGQAVSNGVRNSSDTASSNAVIGISTAGTSGGVAIVQFNNTTDTNWSIGIASPTNSSFKINPSDTVGTGDIFVATTAGDISIPVGDLSVIRSESGGNVLASVVNQSNTASATASLQLTVAGTTASSAHVLYQISAGNTFVAGIKASDSTFRIAPVTLGTNDSVVITQAGEVTMPLQPAFSAYLSATATNVTGDGTGYTIVWNTEAFDQNSDFNTGTGTFTAPVTGKYQLSVSIGLSGIAAGHTDGNVYIQTTARNYTLYNQNPAAETVGGALSFNGSVLADMSATDTAIVILTVSGGAKVIGVAGGASGQSFFQGVLVC